MTESRRYPLGNQLDIQQILIEAQHRWLRPAEICEILSNHKRFHIAPESPHMPPNGSLFLFDRKVLRYFRKDGHSWRKKKDGKTVKEAHERLKSRSIDVLHCYYAHGEENENFQRRSYWMLEEELSHIVLVHYREVKGNRTNFNSIKNYEDAARHHQQIEDSSVHSEMDTSVSSNSQLDSYQVPARTTDTVSMNGAHASEYEDAESVYSNQASSKYHSFLEVQQPVQENSHVDSNNQGKLSTVSSNDPMSVAQLGKAGDTNGANLPYQSQKHFNLPSWEDFLGNSTHAIESAPPQSSFSSKTETIGIIPKQDEIQRQLSISDFGERQDLGSHFPVQNEWKGSDHPVQDDMTLEGKSTYSSSMKQHLLDSSVSEEGLKKLDSFNRWMSKELGDVSESHVQSSSGAYWDTVEDDVSSRVHLDTYVLGPSLSHDQLFSIIDFTPNWAYVDSAIKVLITGRFLKSQEETQNCKWSCMFGEVEVPAEVIADGVLRCQTPLNKAGVVPFYVSCSDRVACSEVREFEYRPSPIQDVDITDICSSTSTDLCMRFGQLLSSSCASIPKHYTRNTDEICQSSDRISSFLKEDTDKMDEMLNLTSEAGASLDNVKEELLQKLLKDRLHVWLLQKAAEGGKGPSVLDEGGQGVLHFAAALGYDWALEPTIISGVSVNFRDVNGWTALHWAASCGRLRTIATLILLGAAPGLVTDPSPTYPTGRTPADIASANGHKGIAGYLAESALSAQLSSLDLEKKNSNPAESSGAKPEVCTSNSDGHLRHELSLKDSLAAVCNATQAAARIHQVFRVRSFQKKQLKEFGDDKLGMSDQRVLSLIALKANKPGQPDEPVHSAAVRIQNKFRSWKGRKEFLIIRQRIVKIQAHVRGHQVRKNYRKIVWSVGIVEKVILRWRRKRSGLRGFKSEAITESSSKQDVLSKEDDYDFLKEGRKQTEARSQVALARVKSMHQYPEARDQYSRLLSVVTEIQETKVVYDNKNNLKSAGEFDDLIDIEDLLDDDTFMPTTC